MTAQSEPQHAEPDTEDADTGSAENSGHRGPEVPVRAGRRHRRILALAIPAMATLVADPLLGLVDTAVVGRLGAQPLAALGLGVAVLATVSWVFNFLVYGTTAAVAHAVGAGDRRTAGRRVAHAGWAAGALGLTAGVFVLIAAPHLLRALGAVESIVGPGTTYLRIRAVGIVGLLLGYVGHGAFRGVSDTRTPLVVAVTANIVNGILDVVLVFGLDMGLAGAAWATVAAELLTAAAFAVLVAAPGRATSHRAGRLLDALGLPLSGHGLPTWVEIRELAAVSRDLFLRTGALVFGLLAVTSAAARIGAVTTAAHQVIWQTWIFISLFMDGFAIAAQAMVGTALGAGRPGRARATARSLLAWGIGGGLVIAVILLVLHGVIPRLLTDEPAVLAAVATAWWLGAGGHVINGLVFVLDGVFMGAGDFAYLRTWTVLAAVVAAVLAQVTVVAGWGLLGLWVAIEAMMVVRLAALALRLRSGVWMWSRSSAPERK